MKIAVIGGGSMGMAFVRSWLSRENQRPEDIIVIESSPEQAEKIKKEFPVSIGADYEPAKDAQFIFVAVKPQDFGALAKTLAPSLRHDQIIISIMAGVPLSMISQKLGGHKKIVRVMPNLPILVASGISVYFAAPPIEHVAISIIEQLLEAGGEILRLESEELLDAVTALSGSGPGYVFYIIQNFMQAALKLGFTEEQAQKLISCTMKGSVELWERDRRSAAELMKAVTSKGGTTAAALDHFEKHELGKVLIEAIVKAKERARELSGAIS